MNSKRLAEEKSPYLLQHKENPVNWYPWGQEAFSLAAAENKPIFLSIGYSTCHWCHVMAEESFENEEIARIMNENFVNVKVDREERPDVDRQYMVYVQMTTGSGGWPLTLFLTPDLKPIYGGTYFPPRSRDKRIGMYELTRLMAERWRRDAPSVQSAAENAMKSVRQTVELNAIGIDKNGDTQRLKAVQRAFASLQANYDAANGGFGGAPKFPSPTYLSFLMYYYYLWKDLHKSAKDATATELRSRWDMMGSNSHPTTEAEQAEMVEQWRQVVDKGMLMGATALQMVEESLKKMAMGGIRDHIGKGFHRYSVDAKFHVPHFEKMLYDQAQLLAIYSDAFLATKNETFKAIAGEITEYVMENLYKADLGAFCCGQDADSLPEAGAAKKKEGAFAVWEESEIVQLLGAEDAKVFNHHFGVKPDGNVDAALDAHGQLTKKNVLMEQGTMEETAKHFEMKTEQVAAIMEKCKAKLLAERKKRPAPNLDDKFITSWNAQMISGLCCAFRAFGEEKFLKPAVRAAAFIRDNLYVSEGVGLLRSYRNGPSSIAAFADDYAFTIKALIDLYEITFDESYLSWAIDLQHAMDEQFCDKSGLGYYSARADDPYILVRIKEDYDGTEPCPNSVTAMNLERLHFITGKRQYMERAKQIMTVFTRRLDKVPHAMTTLLCAITFYSAKPFQVVISGSTKGNEERIESMLKVIRSEHTPHKVVVRQSPESDLLNAAKRATGQKFDKASLATLNVQVCRGNISSAPTDDVSVLLKQLQI